MSEFKADSDPKPQNPELLLAEVAVNDLCDEIFALKPEEVILTFWAFGSKCEPEKVRERLKKSSFSDLMLKNGDTLSELPPDQYHNDLGLYIGTTPLHTVEICAWKQERDKYRIDPNGPKQPPFNVIEYPGEKDWRRSLDIKLWYGRGKEVFESLRVDTDSDDPGSLPYFSSKVFATAYAEMGYSGHHWQGREARDQTEVLDFVALARKIFKDRT
jgi:hypothetical protein